MLYILSFGPAVWLSGQAIGAGVDIETANQILFAIYFPVNLLHFIPGVNWLLSKYVSLFVDVGGSP